MDLTDLSVLDALDVMRGGECSSEELTGAYLERIERMDRGLLQAFVTVTPELALQQARAADARRRAGDEAPLLGVPMALKDLVLTRGVRTTCSSRILEQFTPIEDATITEKLYAAGAVLVGDPGTFLQGLALGSEWLLDERVEACLVIGAYFVVSDGKRL